MFPMVVLGMAPLLLAIMMSGVMVGSSRFSLSPVYSVSNTSKLAVSCLCSADACCRR